MKPGRDPLAGTTNAEDEVRAKGLTNESIFTGWCEGALKDGRDKRVVLFIDQFEEVFAQIKAEEESIAFLNPLTHAKETENGCVMILFSMRSAKQEVIHCAGMRAASIPLHSARMARG